MIKSLLSIVIFLTVSQCVHGQPVVSFADSIRKVYDIPEVGFAVVSSNDILELHVLGEKKIHNQRKAELSDKFRIGSNTKAITGFIAAQLVKQKKITWDARFFTLFPELKAKSNRAYHNLTLLQLLTFRTKLVPYTYTYSEPGKEWFTGNEEEQCYQFVSWFFRQKPVRSRDSINFSNVGYVAAGLMLEKAAGKSYKQLVAELGHELDVDFGFGAPNSTDTLQPWGHDQNLKTEPPGDNYKLDWLLAAGNINVSLPDYCKFIQLQLRGLRGESSLLTKEEYSFLHFGLTRFAVGWFWSVDENGRMYSYNIGNPGSFLTKVYVVKDIDRAFILFANAQTERTDTGLNVLLAELKRKYGR